MNKKKTAFICLLIIIVLITGTSMFLYVKNKTSDIKNSNLQAAEIYDSMADNIKKGKLYMSMREDLSSEINSLNIIKDISQSEVINMLSAMFDSCDINPSKIEFAKIQCLQDDGEPEDNSSINVQVLDVSINFLSETNTILKFMDMICNNMSYIDIAGVRLINSEGAGDVNCTINLRFFGFPLTGLH